jgi:outer membrane protein
VGVINARRILSESRVAKEAMAKFQLDFGARGKDVISQTAVLKQKADELEKMLPTLSPAQQQERQRDLSAQNRELDRKKQQLAEDREARQRDDIQHIIQLARGVVAHIAEDTKLAAVFQDVVYVNPKNDITDKVLQAMDAQKSN